MNTITREFTKEQLIERAKKKIATMRFCIAQSAYESVRESLEIELHLAEIALTSLEAEKGASLQLRNLIRQRHAEWSEKTFGNVGPVGPLKHLSKEAQEAAVEPDDLSEWADMQFLLWDAQRRAGISDGEITAAMEEKLKVNMARQWPGPKDGEPRLHIKEAGNSPVIPDGYALVPIIPTEGMVINGFESEPDPHFSDEKEWAEYEALSGCRQAARRAELCWAAMIKAAPKMETN